MLISPISQKHYTTSADFSQKVNLSLQCAFGSSHDSVQFGVMNSGDEAKYEEIKNSLPLDKKFELEILRRKGILTDNRSNDKTSTLENLHKILTTERADGFDNLDTLKETISHLNNPYLISQKSDNSITNYLEAAFSPKTPIFNKDNSSTCTAACIEFDLAKQEPAEFTRFVEGLTSPKLAVEKTINLENLANKTLDAIWLLNIFEIPHEENDFHKTKLTFKPDNMVLLKINLNNKTKNLRQRGNIDTVLQSTFMNVGSQQSYNSLTDKRQGNFYVTERGLIEYEKTFVESVVRDKNIISVNYQHINNNGEIAGYEADFDTIKQQLLDTLELHENIIAGLTNKTPLGKLKGHEIVITGAKTNAQGKTDFICYNSDMDKTKPLIYSEDYILPRLHHAGLPEAVVLKNMSFKDGWTMELENYKALRQNA